VRPSSKASLEAAASSTPSDDSHPPFGTVTCLVQAAQRHRARIGQYMIMTDKKGPKGGTEESGRKEMQSQECSTHRPSVVAVSGW
jgi:hypothetical protein